jgi:hypothetical protein
VPGSAHPGRPAAPLAELQRRVGREGGRVLGLAGALPPNLAAAAGLADLRSHDPIRPRSLAVLHRALGVDGLDLPGPVTRPWAALAGAWGVRWLATPPAGLPPGSVAAGWSESFRDGDACIFRNTRALPPLRLATRATPPPAGDPRDGAWEAIDFATTAVLEHPPRLSGQGGIEPLSSRPWKVVARVDSDGDVLALLHTPRTVGWRGYLDGRSVPLLTANLAAMAVVVPRGAHEVRFEYAPVGLLPGVLLTVTGLVGCVLLARRRRVP